MKIVTWLTHPLRSLRYSLSGLLAVFAHECAFQQEIILGVVHIALVLLIDESLPVKLVMVSLWALLMAAELLNSAIEATVDLVSPEKNPLAGKAKDCASAAVLVILLTICVFWLIILWRVISHDGS